MLQPYNRVIIVTTLEGSTRLYKGCYLVPGTTPYLATTPWLEAAPVDYSEDFQVTHLGDRALDRFTYLTTKYEVINHYPEVVNPLEIPPLNSESFWSAYLQQTP